VVTVTPLQMLSWKQALAFPRPVRLWGWLCLDLHQGARPQLPASTRGLTAFWGARGEAELPPRSGSAAAVQLPFPGGSERAAPGAVWLVPHQEQGQIPSPEAPIRCLCLCLLMALKAAGCE